MRAGRYPYTPKIQVDWPFTLVTVDIREEKPRVVVKVGGRFVADTKSGNCVIVLAPDNYKLTLADDDFDSLPIMQRSGPGHHVTAFRCEGGKRADVRVSRCMKLKTKLLSCTLTHSRVNVVGSNELPMRESIAAAPSIQWRARRSDGTIFHHKCLCLRSSGGWQLGTFRPGHSDTFYPVD